MQKQSISQRVRAVSTPVIPVINQLARAHPGTLSLGQGVAYYGPPPQAYQEVEQQLSSHILNMYGPVEGIPELASALAEKLAARNNIRMQRHNKIFVTAGANMAFSSLMLALTDPGDEIILLTPYYFNHEMAIQLANATPVLVPVCENFHPDTDAIRAAITAKTRAIVTVSPNNPSGAVYTRQELTAINQLCAQHGIYHISDEVYEDFVYDHHQHFSAASLTNSEAHTISLYSLSKAYGFAGWRIGYMVIPEKLLTSLRKVQDTVLISPGMVSQYAALGAHKAAYAYIENKITEIKKSRRICLQQLNHSGLLAAPAHSEGAFYIFLKLKTRQDDFTVARQLIEQHGIAAIPGQAFAAGAQAYLRISYGALTGKTVEKAIKKLIGGLSKL